MSMPEMLFLGLLGLVIFGPKKLVSAGQEAGKALARLRKMSADFQVQLEAEISPASAASNSGKSTRSGCNLGSQFPS
jgi:Sec-independent protein translocase protein TatA